MDETNNERITPKDIYKELWHGRDFELEHLWQRSVFLAAFMLAIAGGYGALVKELLFPDSCCANVGKCLAKLQNMAATGLCYLGMAFSILWVMMAKGSKYWFEQYEHSINKFMDLAYKRRVLYDLNDYPFHGYLVEPPQKSSSIFSTKPYRYSVSKVNCVIGIVGILCWISLSIVHLSIVLKCFGIERKMQYCLLAVAISLCVFAVQYSLLAICCRSGEA